MVKFPQSYGSQKVMHSIPEDISRILTHCKWKLDSNSAWLVLAKNRHAILSFSDNANEGGGLVPEFTPAEIALSINGRVYRHPSLSRSLIGVPYKFMKSGVIHSSAKDLILQTTNSLNCFASTISEDLLESIVDCKPDQELFLLSRSRLDSALEIKRLISNQPSSGVKFLDKKQICGITSSDQELFQEVDQYFRINVNRTLDIRPISEFANRHKFSLVNLTNCEVLNTRCEIESPAIETRRGRFPWYSPELLSFICDLQLKKPATINNSDLTDEVKIVWVDNEGAFFTIFIGFTVQDNVFTLDIEHNFKPISSARYPHVDNLVKDINYFIMKWS